MFNIIASVIMGMLVITTLVVFARTKRTGRNNLFGLLLIAIAASAVVAYNLTKPSWWALAILAYGMTILFITLRWVRKDLIKNEIIFILRSRNNLITTLQVLIGCTISVFGVLSLLSEWTWYTACVWIPLTAVGIYMVFRWIHNVLKKIWRSSTALLVGHSLWVKLGSRPLP